MFWDKVISRVSGAMEMDWVVSSEQALKHIETATKQRRPYDLVIVDLFLAGSDTGLDFLKSKTVRDLKVKTILVSAADKDSLEAYLKEELAGTRVITKPLSITKCEHTLNEMMF